MARLMRHCVSGYGPETGLCLLKNIEIMLQSLSDGPFDASLCIGLWAGDRPMRRFKPQGWGL